MAAKEKTRTQLMDEVRQLRQRLADLASQRQPGASNNSLPLLEALHYKTLVEQLPVHTYATSLDDAGTMLFVNPRTLRLLGFTQQDYRDDPDLWIKQLHPDDRDRVLAEVARTRKLKVDFVSQYRMLHKSGDIIWVHDEARIAHDQSGTPLFWVGVVYDITAYRRSEQELIRANALLENILTQAPVGIQVLEKGPGGWSPAFSNAEASNISRESKKTMQNILKQDENVPNHGTLPCVLLNPDGSPVALEETPLVLAASRGKTTINRELVGRWDNGLEKTVLCNAKPVLNDGGNPVAAVMTLSDISEQKESEAALRASEARFRSIAETSIDAIFTVSSNARITYVNSETARMFGYEKKELTGRSLMALFPSHLQIGHMAASIDGMLPELQHPRTETVFVRKDGSEFLAECAFSQWDINGEKQYCLIARDITSRKKFEKQLANTTRFLDRIMQSSPDCIITTDMQGIITSINSAFTRITGYPADAVLGRKISEFGPPKPGSYHATTGENVHINNAYFDYCRIMKDRLTVDFNNNSVPYWIVAKNNDLIPMDCKISILSDKGGPPEGIVVIMRDITIQKKADMQQHMSEKRLSLALESTDDGVWDYHLPEGKMYYNHRWFSMLGYKVDAFEHSLTTLYNLVHPHDLPRVQQIFLSYLEGHTSHYRAEFRMLGADGSWQWIYSRGKTIEWDYQGRATRIVGTHTDITVRKQAEESLRNMNADLDFRVRKRTAALNKTNEYLTREIHEHRKTEQALRANEADLALKHKSLEEANKALRILLKKRDADRMDIEDKVQNNVHALIMPNLKKLEELAQDSRQREHISIIASSLNHIVSPFAKSLTSSHLNLTTSELQIANLIKEGCKTKEIADLLEISPRTVDVHRDNIRNKLGIKNKKTHLRTHLLSLQ